MVVLKDLTCTNINTKLSVYPTIISTVHTEVVGQLIPMRNRIDQRFQEIKSFHNGLLGEHKFNAIYQK